MIGFFLTLGMILAFLYGAAWFYNAVVRAYFPRLGPLAYILIWVMIIGLYFNSPAGRQSIDSALCGSAEALLDKALADGADGDLTRPCDAYYDSCVRDGDSPRPEINRLCRRA